MGIPSDHNHRAAFKNRWWKGGSKAVSKNILKRVCWSWFNAFRTSKEHIVYLSAAFGIALIFLGQWLTTVCIAQKEKLIIPLRETDDAFDDVIAGLNFLTQTLPVDVEVWLNSTIWETQAEMQLLLNNAASGLEKPINHIASAIEDTINEVVAWAKQQTGNSSPWTPVTLPMISIVTPDITGWAPALPPLDLSAAQIPRRQFSVEVELTPFVTEVFNIPLVIAYYLVAVGAVLITYSAARVGWSVIKPWIPRANCLGCAQCVKCLTLTAKAMQNVAQTIVKPWIHIPLLIGLALTLVVSLLLFAAVDNVDLEIRGPLKQADDAILGIIWKINNFTADIPGEVKSFTDSIETVVEGSAYTTLESGVSSIKGFLSSGFNAIQNAINLCLSSLSLPQITIPNTIPEDVVGVLVNIPKSFLPRIPLLDLSALYLPESMAGIEAALVPWIDDRMREFREVITVLLIIAVILIVLPGSALAGAFIKPFIPHNINEFFLRPDYEDHPEMEEKEDDLELNKTKSHKSNSSSISISDPKFVEPPPYEDPLKIV